MNKLRGAITVCMRDLLDFCERRGIPGTEGTVIPPSPMLSTSVSILRFGDIQTQRLGIIAFPSSCDDCHSTQSSKTGLESRRRKTDD